MTAGAARPPFLSCKGQGAGGPGGSFFEKTARVRDQTEGWSNPGQNEAGQVPGRIIEALVFMELYFIFAPLFEICLQI